MRILVAEDDPISRKVLEATLTKWNYEVLVAGDGVQAWQIIQRDNSLDLAILDWMMPEMAGIDVCRKVRELPALQALYIILLTAKGERADIIEGLEAGADDYLVKPFDHGELKARLQAGVRIVELQKKLAEHIKELEEALSHIRTLQGLLPICSYCKKIRNDQNYWQQFEGYIGQHSELRFSHGICPECYEKIVKPQLAERKKMKADDKSLPAE